MSVSGPSPTASEPAADTRVRHLDEFVRMARVRGVALLDDHGAVLAQAGDGVTVTASVAERVVATGHPLLVDGPRNVLVHVEPLRCGSLVVSFDARSSLAVVRLRLRTLVQALQPSG